MAMNGWIGVDLDGTLAEYHGWNGGVIGGPIPAMLARVKSWLAWTDSGHQGPAVKIFTARACVLLMKDATEQERDEASDQIRRIEEWCELHIGRKLPVTCVKDFSMIALWDDRAVQVEPNTGRRMDGGDGFGFA